MLVREQPRLSTALDRLRLFSDTATQVINDTQDDLVHNLQNLEPTIRALADVGPDIDTALAFAPLFPLGQNLVDRGIRGDYMNLFVTIDLTKARLKRGLAAGTTLGRRERRVGTRAGRSPIRRLLHAASPRSRSGTRRRTARPAPTADDRGWLMLTRFVRIQLAIFAVASVVGVAVMVVNYLQAPTLLGVGRIAVTWRCPVRAGCTDSPTSPTAAYRSAG